MKTIRNDDTFSQLYLQYHAPLCRFANKILSDPAASEDIVEDVFLRVWERRDTFQSEEHIRAFLYQAIKNACLDAIKITMRAEKRHESYTKTNYPSLNEQDYLVNIVQTEIIIELHRAIETLPAKMREIIQMSYMEGKSNQEVADELGLSLQTVKNQKYRGLSLLKGMLSKEQLFLASLYFFKF